LQQDEGSSSSPLASPPAQVVQPRGAEEPEGAVDDWPEEPFYDEPLFLEPPSPDSRLPSAAASAAADGDPTATVARSAVGATEPAASEPAASPAAAPARVKKNPLRAIAVRYHANEAGSVTGFLQRQAAASSMSLGAEAPKGATNVEPSGDSSLSSAAAAASAAATASPAAAASAGSADRRLYVGGVGYDVSWMALKDHFSQAGDVVYCEAKTDGSGLHRGFAIVEFSSSADAARASRPPLDARLPSLLSSQVSSLWLSNNTHAMSSRPASLSLNHYIPLPRSPRRVPSTSLTRRPSTGARSTCASTSATRTAQPAPRRTTARRRHRPRRRRQSRRRRRRRVPLPARGAVLCPTASINPLPHACRQGCGVFVGNLEHAVSAAELEELCEDDLHLDVVRTIELPRNSNRSFVLVFGSAKVARKAIRELDERRWRGRPMRAREFFERGYSPQQVARGEVLSSGRERGRPADARDSKRARR